MKKVGKTIVPFRYDLNQIPYDYTVTVVNSFEEFDLVDRVPKELWTEVHNIVQEGVTKTIPKKKDCKKAKSDCRRRLHKYRGKKRRERQGRKGKIYPSKAVFQRTVRRDKKAFFNEKCKEIEENNRMRQTRDLLKKKKKNPPRPQDIKGIFHATRAR